MIPRLNNEGETPKQERTEPVETKAEEKAEIKAYAASQKAHSSAKSMFDVKPGDRLPHESKFKK